MADKDLTRTTWLTTSAALSCTPACAAPAWWRTTPGQQYRRWPVPGGRNSQKISSPASRGWPERPSYQPHPPPPTASEWPPPSQIRTPWFPGWSRCPLTMSRYRRLPSSLTFGSWVGESVLWMVLSVFKRHFEVLERHHSKILWLFRWRKFPSFFPSSRDIFRFWSGIIITYFSCWVGESFLWVVFSVFKREFEVLEQHHRNLPWLLSSRQLLLESFFSLQERFWGSGAASLFDFSWH